MIVRGEGELSSSIWIIGEAPGIKEDAEGKPFVGGTGLILNSMLNEAGIKRDACYVDNVLQTKSLGNNFKTYYSDKSKRHPKVLLLQAHERIKTLVRVHKPNVIMALGNEALYALTGKTGIQKWRGSILGCHGVKVIPSYSPTMVMKQFKLRPISIMDFHRGKTEGLSPTFPTCYKDQFVINPSYKELMEYWFPFLHKQQYLSFDIETDIHLQQIECIGFGWAKDKAICIPIFYGMKSWFTPVEEKAIILELQKLFQNKSIKFIAQNAQFDMTYNKDKWGCEVANLWMDTMLGFHCIYPELKKGLAFLASIYTKRPYYKDDSGGSANQRWTYNCIDCVATFECAMEIQKELKEFGTYDFYYKYSHPLIEPLMEMQRTGMLIDQKKRIEIDKNLEADLLSLQSRLDKTVGHELNVASPKQMQEFLYGDLRLPIQYKVTAGKKRITCADEALTKLAGMFPNPVFILIQDIRSIRKLLSTYIRAPLNNDGRIRCSYVITGTETGRLSSRKSIYGSGTNLQNIPRGELVRSLFIADPGMCLVNADLSQAEARVVAYVSGETRLQALFENPEVEVYKRIAGVFFKKHDSQVTSQERQQIKQVVHASNYMVRSNRLSILLGCPEPRAREFLNQYYAMFPCIKLWHREIESQLGSKRILTTPFGRKRMFFGRWDSNLLREAVAYIPQSTVGDALNYGIVRAYPNLPPTWYFVLQNHDAIMAQLPEETPDEHIWKFFNHYFEFPITIGHKSFSIPMDIKRGKDWGNLKEITIE